MTRQQELDCPRCGATIYFTDVVCLSCGVWLDGGKPIELPGAHRPATEAPPVTVVSWNEKTVIPHRCPGGSSHPEPAH